MFGNDKAEEQKEPKVKENKGKKGKRIKMPKVYSSLVEEISDSDE